MEPYIYKRVNGDVLQIMGTGEVAVINVQPAEGDDSATVVIDAADVDEIHRRMREAAGLPSPVILERPLSDRDALVVGPHGAEILSVTPSPAGGPANIPGVVLKIAVGSAESSVRLVSDEPLRTALALVDAMAEAEAEPDPAEIEALAMVINSGREVRLTAADVARKILLAGYAKSAGGAS